MTDSTMEQLPEQAPIDLIVGSRELLRGKVRRNQFLSAGSQTFLVAIVTWSESTNDLNATKPYWLYAIIGVLFGVVLSTVFTRGRTLSARRQRAAIERAWRKAKVWASPSPKQRWTLLATIVGVIVGATALILGALWIAGWSHFYVLVAPLLGASAGMLWGRVMRTFRWATWFGPGAIDPDIAGELMRSMIKARKVQHYAAMYARTHPAAGDQ